MKKRIFLTLVTLAIGVITLSCVSPFYGTARIEKGWHVSVGLGPTSYIAGFGEGNSHFLGVRGDVELCYGFNKYLQSNARLGLGLGLKEERIDFPLYPFGFPLLFDGAVGVQVALPLDYITPSCKVEVVASHYNLLASTLLIGIGHREFLTLGGRMRAVGFSETSFDALVGIHPISRLTIFVGVDVRSILDQDDPLLGTVGVGYKLR